MRYEDRRGWLYEVRPLLGGLFRPFYRKPRANPDLSIGWKSCHGFEAYPYKDDAERALEAYAKERNMKAV